MTGTTLLLAIGLFVLLLFLHYLFGAEHPVRCVCYSGGIGLASLLLTHVVGVLAGFCQPAIVAGFGSCRSRRSNGIAHLQHMDCVKK